MVTEKGPLIGRVPKRNADAHLASGHDIPDAETLFNVLIETGTRIKLVFVNENEVEAMPRTGIASTSFCLGHIRI